MCTSHNPYAGVTPKGSSRQTAVQPSLALGCLTDSDRRKMLVNWFERDLSAWEARTGHRVTIRASGDRAPVAWQVDGRRIASCDLSDVVYGRLDLETALGDLPSSIH